MTLKTALLFFAIAMAMSVSVGTASRAFADDAPVDKAAYNQADPKYADEQARQADETRTEGTAISSATCPTGTCFKNTTGGFVTDGEQINPTGNAATQTPTQTQGVKK